MFKQLITLLFFVAFALQTFSRAFIVLDYYSNTQAYAQKCENKAKPQMHCNGKCQMAKKMKEEQKKEDKNPERKAEYKTEYVISSKSFFPSITPVLYSEEIRYPELNTAKEIRVSNKTFHPPAMG